MAKNDASLIQPSLIQPADIVDAVQLLTRLPVPSNDAPRGAAAAWAYPLAGTILGALAAAVGITGHAFGLPAPLSALLSLATLIIATGALHEDGLADTADGLWGGWTVERRLEIMKDSRIGAYGVIALFLGLAARWAALWMLFETSPEAAAAAILVACTASRAMMPGVMAMLPHAREDGLSARVGDVPLPAALVALGIALLVALIFAGWGGLLALFWALVVTAALARIAMVKIGGQTGDILGATQQLAEIAIFLSLLV
ncbi:MAG: adenosylcobinamide-GDP ribazoletransferase [Pseudomonadota bacterium]